MNFKQVGLLISVALLVMTAIAISNSTAETSDGVETQIIVFLDSLYTAKQSSWMAWFDNLAGTNNTEISASLSKEETIPISEKSVENHFEESVDNSSERIRDLQNYVNNLEGVDTGTKSSLAANLNNAIMMAEEEDNEKTIQRLEKVIESIEEQLLPKDRLSSEQAEYIVCELEGIIELIQDLDVVETPINNTPLRAEGTETFISYSGGESKSVVYGGWIAWENWRGMGPSEICLYNISSEEQLSLTPVNSQSKEPAIYGDRLIWRDSRDNLTSGYVFDGIFIHNISTNETSALIEVPANDPAIYDDIIVWADSRNGNSDILMYNMSTGEESLITADTSNQINPQIYGDIIVWQDDRNYEGLRNDDTFDYVNEFFRMLQGSDFSEIWDIYMYNISTGEEKQITVHVSNQINPTIYDDKIVWQDYRNWNWDIYMYNLSSGEEIQITTDAAPQTEPSIYGNRIVWTDRRDNGNYEIYMYDISIGKEFRVTNWAETDGMCVGWRRLPTIYENRILWFDERYGTQLCSIFMFTLGEQLTPDSEGTVEESVEYTNKVADVENIKSELDKNTTNESLVENTTSEAIDNVTTDSTSEQTVEVLDNKTEEQIIGDASEESSVEEGGNKTIESSEEGTVEDTSEQSNEESSRTISEENEDEQTDESVQETDETLTEEQMEETEEDKTEENVEDAEEEQAVSNESQ